MARLIDHYLSETTMSILVGFLLAWLAIWAGAWFFVIVGMAIVKLTDFITSLFEGKWQ